MGFDHLVKPVYLRKGGTEFYRNSSSVEMIITQYPYKVLAAASHYKEEIFATKNDDSTWRTF